jgi:hypothetical protein
MAHDRLAQKVLEAQERAFRLAFRDYGLTLAQISRDSNIGYNSIRAYAGNNGEQQMMPVSALLKLVGVIPDDLLSHLLEPVGKQITSAPELGE